MSTPEATTAAAMQPNATAKSPTKSRLTRPTITTTRTNIIVHATTIANTNADDMAGSCRLR